MIPSTLLSAYSLCVMIQRMNRTSAAEVDLRDEPVLVATNVEHDVGRDEIRRVEGVLHLRETRSR